VAQVFLYGPYEILGEPPGILAPGAFQHLHWGPLNWGDHTVTVSAHASNSPPLMDRRVEVTRVWTQAKASGEQWLYATVTNVGNNPTNFWADLGVIKS
jgi:hypothetical protein